MREVFLKSLNLKYKLGFKAEYIVTDRQKISDMSQRRPPTLIGVEQSEKVVEWIWNNFSAVGGDQPGFECFRKSAFALSNAMRLTYF